MLRVVTLGMEISKSFNFFSPIKFVFFSFLFFDLVSYSHGDSLTFNSVIRIALHFRDRTFFFSYVTHLQLITILYLLTVDLFEYSPHTYTHTLAFRFFSSIGVSALQLQLDRIFKRMSLFCHFKYKSIITCAWYFKLRKDQIIHSQSTDAI